MHFNFVSPFDCPDYAPQDGDTWTDFADGQWDETGTVKTGGKLIARRFSDGEWKEYDPVAEWPQALRDELEAVKRERLRDSITSQFSAYRGASVKTEEP